MTGTSLSGPVRYCSSVAWSGSTRPSGTGPVRWSEYAFQSYSNSLLGLALVLLGSAMVLGAVYPRRLGAVAAASGVAWVVHGAVVP